MVQRATVDLRTATRAWFAISWQTFGGPAGQIAVMQRVLVEEKRWIGQQRFLHALGFCMLLPGPEAQQLAIYTGWLLNGLRGGLIAGALFVLPGVLTLLVLSALYVGLGDSTFVDALFQGLGPAVVAVVVQAVVRVARRALTSAATVAIAVVAFIALSVAGVPFPLVIAAAALAGWLLERRRPAVEPDPSEDLDTSATAVVDDSAGHAERPSMRRAGALLVTGVLLWWAPVAAVAAVWGPDSVVVDQAVFFSGSALVTFGGAYAVLAYVAHAAVDVYGWLLPGEMVRGLALAETTPGPLIMVVQFVAFVGAYRDPAASHPWLVAVVAALLTTWVTFVPCFLFVLLGAPYVERLRRNRQLSAALAGITAAVVGVIASLAVFFAQHTLFDATRQWHTGVVDMELPVFSAIDPVAVAIAGLGCLLIFWRRWSVLWTLGACALAGVAAAVLGG